jgi:copper(I)-binding protein
MTPQIPSSVRRALRVAALAALALAIASPALASDLSVANGRIPLPMPGEDPPVYLVVQSRSQETRTIVGARSERAGSVEIRRTSVVDGQWDSEAMPEGMPVPAGGAVAFAPRGLFLRLVGVGKLEAGEKVTIVLELDGGEELAFEAVVEDE